MGISAIWALFALGYLVGCWLVCLIFLGRPRKGGRGAAGVNEAREPDAAPD